MLKNIRAISLLLASIAYFSQAGFSQTIPASRTTDWSRAGLLDSVPSYSMVVNIMNYGGVNDGTATNHPAFQNALTALGGAPGVIYFPPGTYLFTQGISLTDSVIIRGAGKDSTRLQFDFGGITQHCINMLGPITGANWNVIQPAAKGSNMLVLDNTAILSVGDWILLTGNDSSIITSSWAYGTVGQVLRIDDIKNDTIVLHQGLRRNYDLSFSPYLRQIAPVQGSGIECLYIEREDSTALQTYNINMTNAVNCWVIGIESFQTNFAHIGLTRSAHILVRGNYLHHSHAYGGGGQGYGVVAQYTTGDCLIENNIFEHLRHSMLLQAGANGNVFAYNYSFDPFWTEPPLPAVSAGDAVLHGNYPYLNLFEGNIVQNIVVDNSHGINGPYNTFFRNRAQLYGIVNNSGAGDSTSYVGNEVTSTAPFTGLYTITGNGNFEYGNNVKGTIMPPGTTNLPEESLYRISEPGYWLQHLQWPSIGTPRPYNQGGNPAASNSANVPTDCRRNPVFVREIYIDDVKLDYGLHIYPNPAKDHVVFDYTLPGQTGKIIITDITGRAITNIHLDNKTGKTYWNSEDAAPGIYLYRLMDDGATLQTGKIIITK